MARDGEAPAVSGLGRRRAASALVLLALAAASGSGGAFARPAADTVTITEGPSGETTSTSATFSFVGTGAVTHFRCALDTRVLSPCVPPVVYEVLAVGGHTFTVAGYRGETSVGVSASRDWTIVAPAPGPQPPSPPAPPPLQAVLALSTAAVAPSTPVVLDATGSTGAIQDLKYDLDGNGAYETSCGQTGKVAAAFASPGTYSVGVMTVAPEGAVATTSKQVTVSGAAQPPPGAKALSPGVTVAGACAGDGAAVNVVNALLCPTTLVVGVAEAAFPAGAPKGACFTRDTLPPPLSLERYLAPASQVVLVNGLRIQPSKGSRFLTIPVAKALGVDPGTARVSVSLGKPNVDLDGGHGPLTWNIGKPGAVGELQLDTDDRFLGLALPALKTPIVLTADHKARLAFRLKLPVPFERASGKLQLTTDNTAGPVIEAFTVKMDDIPIGPMTLEKVMLAYHQQGKVDAWDGSFALRLPPVGPGPTVGSTLSVRDGALTALAIEIKKENPGWGPIACCSYMTRLKGWYTGPDEEVKTHYTLGAETDLTAGPKILGWSLLKLTAAGRLHWHPDYGAVLEVEGDLHMVEKFKLASGSLFAKMGDGGTWIWFDGSASWNMIAFTATGTVSGAIGVVPGATVPWSLSGGVSVCVVFVDVCAGGKVAASAKGVAGCLWADVEVSTLAAGAVYYWNGSWSTFWGCSKEKVQGKVGALALESAGSGLAEARSIEIPAGMRSYLVKVSGAGGAPLVALVGPTGRRIVTPGPDEPKTDRKTWLAVAVPSENATYFDIGRPQAGTWRIEPLPGSAPIRGIGVAEPLPARLVRASVGGAGELRTLRYRIEPAGNQQVVFTEVGSGLRRTIATTTAATGTVRFSPGDGTPGVRTIEATVLRDGLVIRTEAVARFRATAARLPAPRVTLVRRGKSVAVRWLPVGGAAAYVVRATVEDGRLLTRQALARSTSLSIPAVGARDAIAVTVSAVSSGDRVGRTGTARLAASPTVDVPRTLRAAVVLRAGGFSIRCALPGDGSCAAAASLRGRTVASGTSPGRYGQVVAVRLKLTAAGRTALRAGGGTLRLTVEVPGEGARRVSVRVQ